jgi:NAD(P)H-nitrite reductase large subunit
MNEVVCYCFSVRRETILAAIRKYGLRTVEGVSQHTGACQGCRTCWLDIEQLIAESAPPANAAAPRRPTPGDPP